MTPEVLEHLRSRLESGAFRPLLDPTTFPLDDIVEAHRYVETGQKLGNVVITVTGRMTPARRPLRGCHLRGRRSASPPWAIRESPEQLR